MAKDALKSGMVHVLVLDVLRDVAPVGALVEALPALPMVRFQPDHPMVHLNIQVEWLWNKKAYDREMFI